MRVWNTPRLRLKGKPEAFVVSFEIDGKSTKEARSDSIAFSAPANKIHGATDRAEKARLTEPIYGGAMQFVALQM